MSFYLTASLSPSISIVADTGQRQYTCWRKDTVERAWQRKATSPAYPYLGILVLLLLIKVERDPLIDLFRQRDICAFDIGFGT